MIKELIDSEEKANSRYTSPPVVSEFSLEEAAGVSQEPEIPKKGISCFNNLSKQFERIQIMGEGHSQVENQLMKEMSQNFRLGYPNL